jgi:thiamine transport system ATP-binding protein
VSGLEVRDLTVTYGSTVAVDAVSLTVGPGETVALLGPSGCGKSSLLGAIVGVVAPASGTVHYDGEDVTAMPVHARRFGLVFQDGQLFPHRTVGGNVSYGLEAQGMARAQRRERVNELLTLVGLAGFEDRGIAELSGGERQRVALARSLAPQPRLLCLDEPLSSLDAALRVRLGAEIHQILSRTRTTALFVTHDPLEAERLATRVLRMQAGRLL